MVNYLLKQFNLLEKRYMLLTTSLILFIILTRLYLSVTTLFSVQQLKSLHMTCITKNMFTLRVWKEMKLKLQTVSTRKSLSDWVLITWNCTTDSNWKTIWYLFLGFFTESEKNRFLQTLRRIQNVAKSKMIDEIPIY